MSILSWFFSLSILGFVFFEAVSLHRATVDRQKRWLKETEIQTARLLSAPPATTKSLIRPTIDFHLSGQL
jgi:hypothetical protein